MQRARYLANLSDARWSAAMTEHDRILHLPEARNAPKLARVLSGHLTAKQDAVPRWLDRRPRRR